MEASEILRYPTRHYEMTMEDLECSSTHSYSKERKRKIFERGANHWATVGLRWQNLKYGNYPTCHCETMIEDTAM